MTMTDVHANDPRWRPQAKLVRSSSPTKIDALDRHDSKTSTESVPGVAKCFGILVPVISTLYLSTNPGGTFVPVISTLYLSTNPGRIRFYCTGSGGPHWKVPVHIGGSLYSGQHSGLKDVSPGIKVVSPGLKVASPWVLTFYAKGPTF